MGKYDMIDRRYFRDAERFADLISVGVFRNRKRVSPKSLQNLERKYPSLRNCSGEYERDELYLDAQYNLKYGLEVEKYNDYGMARRILVYDACEYEKEAVERSRYYEGQKGYDNFEEKKSGMKASDRSYAIIDVVLYTGMGRYKGQRSLRDGYQKIPDDIVPFVYDKLQDYRFVLMEADFVNPQDFQTDLKLFFEFMQARNNKEKMNQLLQQIEDMNLSVETEQVISIHIGQKELEKKVIEEGVAMCKAIRDILKDERREGKQEGRQETLIENLNSLMQKCQFTLDQAMDVLNVELTQREKYRVLLMQK